MSVDLKQEVFDELKFELKKEPTFSDEILELKVKDAYRKVRSRKQYQNTSYTEEMIESHMYNFHFQDVKDLALYNFNKIGAEGQVSHSENGTSRTWRTEDEVLGNICAFVGIL